MKIIMKRQQNMIKNTETSKKEKSEQNVFEIMFANKI